jgi:hypothetical protein
MVAGRNEPSGACEPVVIDFLPGACIVKASRLALVPLAPDDSSERHFEKGGLMRTLRYTALCIAALAVACAKTDKTTDSAAGTVASTPAMSPAAPAIVLTDLAGVWTVIATPTDGKDTASTTTTLTASADTAGWTQSVAGGRPVPVHVRVDGDSIITRAGPYDSFRRKGVKVSTNGVYRLQGGKLVGNVVAHYNTKGADSVLHLRTEGTKAP